MASKGIIDTVDDIDLASVHPEDGGKLSPGPGRESFKLAGFWKDQVNQYEQASAKFVKRGNMVVKRFRDERNRIDEEGMRRMNLLWANFKVMKPAIYSKCPIPTVDRKFLDHDPVARLSSQILERTLINELEDSGFHTAVSMAVNDRLLPGRGVVWCRYVPTIGEGVSIPAPTINGIEDSLFKIGKETGDKALTDETDEEEKLEETNSQVIKENIEVDYVEWRDFYFFPVKARTWAEVQAISKKVHISRKEAIERFGDKIGKSLQPDTTPNIMGATERQSGDTAVFRDINERNIVIYEIWNKSDRRVYWISTGYEYLCDVKDDPLQLTGFFPVPPPLFSTTTNDTLFPVADYIEWQDQAIQIDELTQRLAMLAKACKVAGVYNSAHTSISRIFNEGVENQLIPVDQWALFGDSGGLKGAIDFIPIDQIQATIETLQAVRQQCMIDLDQITGLSDVIRGTSDSRETLGGLRLKNNNAGTRLTETQEDVSRFARDTIKIMAEIVCKHFSDETIIESSSIRHADALQPATVLREMEEQMSGKTGQPQPPQQQPQQPQQQPPQNNVVPFPGGQQQPPQQPMQQPQQQAPQPPAMPPIDPEILIMIKIGKAIELLRGDVRRGYRIDIETDSTVFGDKYQERQDASEFLTALSNYMKQAESAVQLPESLPLFARSLQWAVRKSRVGRDLEAEIDNFAEAMAKKAKQLIENPPPDPDQAKNDMELKKMEMQAQMEERNDMRNHQTQQANDEREHQMAVAQDQREQQKMQLEAQIEQMKAQLEMRKMEMEMEMAQQKHQLEMAKMQAQIHMQKQKMVMDQHSHQQEMQHDQQMQTMEAQHTHAQHTMEHEHAQEQHQMGMQHADQQNKAKIDLQKKQGDLKAKQIKQQAAAKPKPTKKAG